MRTVIDPKNNKIIYRIHNDGDITEGVGNKIVGRIHSDGDVTKGTSREIIGRIHSDGDVTKGTGREIVARIHQDGDITQGTGRKVIGRMTDDNSSVWLGANSEWKDDGGVGMFASVMGIFFVIFGMIFAIFVLPEFLMNEAKKMIQENDMEEIISLLVVLITAVGSCVLGNLLVGKTADLGSRIVVSYVTSYILQVIVVILMDSLYYHDLEGFIGFLAALIVPALIAVIPALVTSIICVVISVISKGKKE